MAKSIMQESKEGFICKVTSELQEHHVIYGTANRKLSEKYGLKVWLCLEHHTGRSGVHFNKDLDLNLKQMAQEYFEANYGTREDFRTIFGKSWL